MAHTSSKIKPLSYSISYGLMGGKMHARKLDKVMHHYGYSYTPITQADIIIAHSAGCWLIPEDCRPRLIIYIGMPLNNDNPRKTLKEAKLLMLRNNTRWGTLRREAKSVYYALAQARRNLGIIRLAHTAPQPAILPDVPAVFIANKDDPWPQSDMLKQLTETMPWTFISLVGGHDDIGVHPERYVEIINRYAGLLG